jgi:hypothetical protein
MGGVLQYDAVIIVAAYSITQISDTDMPEPETPETTVPRPRTEAELLIDSLTVPPPAPLPPAQLARPIASGVWRSLGCGTVFSK